MVLLVNSCLSLCSLRQYGPATRGDNQGEATAGHLRRDVNLGAAPIGLLSVSLDGQTDTLRADVFPLGVSMIDG